MYDFELAFNKKENEDTVVEILVNQLEDPTEHIASILVSPEYTKQVSVKVSETGLDISIQPKEKS